MPATARRALGLLQALLGRRSPEALRRALAPSTEHLPPHVPLDRPGEPPRLHERWSLLPATEERRADLLGTLAPTGDQDELPAYARNCENLIGLLRVPVGLAGPLRVRGLYAQGDYYVPLATTEATLVASYSRGAQVITDAGGCSAALLNEGVSRSPVFAFASLADVGTFVLWVLTEFDALKAVAARTTRHGVLVDVGVAIEGNHVYLDFEYETGDASGQNMVTIATEAIRQDILARSPVVPAYSFIDGNFSGDKKASAQRFTTVRGKKVTAEVRLPRQLVEERLHTTPERLADHWRVAVLGGVLSGTLGVQAHYANGLAALYLATGQDVACVAESAIGVTRFEVESDGGLYASVTLPDIMVGTVGGGTGLPTQRACLEWLGLAGSGHARALAEVCAGLCLAGELSISAAMCSEDFTRAHQSRARGATPS